MFGVDLCHHWKVVRRASCGLGRVERDLSKRTSRMNPDAIHAMTGQDTGNVAGRVATRSGS
jgi:hypothetical protein